MNLHTFRNSVGTIKKLHISVIAVFLFSVIVSPLAANDVFAASLNQSFVRFDRMKISTITTGTICFKPSTATASSSVAVVFPTGYTLGAASSFTVGSTSTTWPAGGTAITGIATANNVAGQTVTFPFTSATLSISTLYCFNWTGTSPAAVTTKSSASSANLGSITLSNGDTAQYSTATIADDQIVVTATVPQIFGFTLSGISDSLPTLDTLSVKTSPTPRTVTVDTNAKNGWQVWAKDSYQGLCSASLGTCTDGTAAAAVHLNTTATGNNRTLVAGTEDYNTGVTGSHTSGTGTLTVASAFVGGVLGKGGGLSATAYQSLATSDGTSDGDILTLNNNVAISSITAAAADYRDLITVIGAGLF